MRRMITVAFVYLLVGVAANFADDQNAPQKEELYTASIGLDANQTPLVLVKIKAGKFKMGNDKFPGEAPAHDVTLTKDYYIGKYEITQGQWNKFKKLDVGQYGWKGDNQPAQYVSRKQCIAFCDWLNKNDKTILSGYEYRLPTEAEWEYACRAGTTSTFFTGEDKSAMDAYAWHETNSKGQTHDVGTKKPNAWGLYDMNGNVWEWCNDLSDKYSAGPQTDPKGPEKLVDPKDPTKTLYPVYVLRGGCWFSGIETLRTTMHHNSDTDHSGNNVACRVVLAPK